MPSVLTLPAACAVTRGPRHHFFGYYDKSPWDPAGHLMLGLETTFMHRPPQEGDAATIGIIQTDDCSWTPLATTRAWNWQQGCMLQWLGDKDTGDIVFNDFRDGQFVACILNIHSGRERIVDRPLYAVNRVGTIGLSVNFARLHHQRPGYGYCNLPDPWRDVGAPEDDGIYAVDLPAGTSRLVLSLAQVAEHGHRTEFNGNIHRFNHLQFGPDNGRFAFLHRHKARELGGKGVGDTRLLTMNVDGSELCCLSDHGMVSHYDWCGSGAILAWALRQGLGQHYFLFRDRADSVAMVGKESLTCDGHCSFSPDGQWMLTDTYPDETEHRTLILFHWPTGRRVDIGRFHSPAMDWEIRCDLHPRWSRDGRRVCIDSIHEGSRQMYVLDVSGIVDSEEWRAD